MSAVTTDDTWSRDRFRPVRVAFDRRCEDLVLALLDRVDTHAIQDAQAWRRRKPAAPPSDEPDPKAQKNFTDPESRIMKTKDGFIQGYNAQAAVDATAQVIVAHALDAKQSDQHQLAPVADAIAANLGRKPAQLSADAGYCSDANLVALEEREIDGYIALGRAKHASAGEGGSARIAAMREKIKAGGHASPYRLRKGLPEPVFGQIKQARGFRQFLLRGVEKVASEPLAKRLTNSLQ